MIQRYRPDPTPTKEATMQNGWTKRIEELEAEVAELTAERDADRKREYGYSQQTVDALTVERDKLKTENERWKNDLDISEAAVGLSGIYATKDKEIVRLEAENKRLREHYNSLIFEVSYKFPGESRHETAKRYIREREEHGIEIVAKQAMKEASHEHK